MNTQLKDFNSGQQTRDLLENSKKHRQKEKYYTATAMRAAYILILSLLLPIMQFKYRNEIILYISTPAFIINLLGFFSIYYSVVHEPDETD